MRYKAFIAGLALAAASAASVGAQAGDQAFVTKLAGVAMAEVELGKLAKDKASSREVKAFADRMIDDHGKAGDELKGIAQRKNLTWPAALPPDAVALKDKLSKLSGAAFDRAYIVCGLSGDSSVATSACATPYMMHDEEKRNRSTPASRAILARRADESKLIASVHASFKLPIGSLLSAARCTTAWNPRRSSGVMSRMSLRTAGIAVGSGTRVHASK